jgi:serine/threonine-protein kinase RsbW
VKPRAIEADTQVHLVIGSQIENVELVQIVLEESLRKLQVDDDTSHAIGISVREAVANAIKHGNRLDPGKSVEVDFGVEHGVVVITVSDEGEGFEPEKVRDPRSPDNLLRPNGRGILFMNSYMDEIEYGFRAEGGTVVTLRKRLSPAPEDSGGQLKEGR